MSLLQSDCPISSVVTGADIMSSAIDVPLREETLAIESSGVSPPIVKEAAPLDLELSDLFGKAYYLLLD